MLWKISSTSSQFVKTFIRAGEKKGISSQVIKLKKHKYLPNMLMIRRIEQVNNPVSPTKWHPVSVQEIHKAQWI